MSLFPGRREVPDELDRLLTAALHAAVRGVRPPARLGAAVCAAAAERPPCVPHRSRLRTLIEGFIACLALGDERLATPVMVHSASFADFGSVSPGLGWWLDYPPGARREPGQRSPTWRNLAVVG